MIHSLDPFAIQFSESFGLRWYGLSYMAGFLIAYFLIRWMAGSGRSLLKINQVADFITYSAIGILAGGRIGYALFYSPNLFVEFTDELPFWNLLALNKGGMASHGGVIGIVVASLLFARKHQVNFRHLLDLVAITGPIGIFFGRLANFVNGELVGREAPKDYPWAVKFPQDIITWPQYEFEKLYKLDEAVNLQGVVPSQWQLWIDQLKQGSLEAQAQVMSQLYKLIDAVQAGNSAVAEALAPHLVARYPSQIHAAIFEGAYVFLILAFIWKKPQRPGIIGACFLMVYAAARIWTEQYRQPDLHIGYELFYLTRGQWLSIATFFAGLALFAYCKKTGPDLKVGGWTLPSKKK